MKVRKRDLLRATFLISGHRQLLADFPAAYRRLLRRVLLVDLLNDVLLDLLDTVVVLFQLRVVQHCEVLDLASCRGLRCNRLEVVLDMLRNQVLDKVHVVSFIRVN